MTLEFRASFLKDLRSIRDRSILRRVRQAIAEIEAASSVLEIRNLKKLRIGGHYYRIRLGNYRLGLTIEDNNCLFYQTSAPERGLPLLWQVLRLPWHSAEDSLFSIR